MRDPVSDSSADPAADPVTSGGASRAEPLTPAAVERLFAEHNRSLIRFLRTRLKSDQEAKDVAQEAYVRLLQIDQPGTVSFLRAYLFRTALNIATDRARAASIRHLAHQDPVFDDVATEPDPERTASAREQLRLVDESLAELPTKQIGRASCRERV